MSEILDRLSAAKVLDLDFNDPEGRHVDLVEACDRYFSVTLTKAELTKLGVELIRISQGMYE